MAVTHCGSTAPPEERDHQLLEQSIAACNQLLAIADAELATQSWLGGEAFGLGDLALGPQIYSLLNLGVPWDAVPNLQRWYQQLTQRPAFQKRVMTPLT